MSLPAMTPPEFKSSFPYSMYSMQGSSPTESLPKDQWTVQKVALPIIRPSLQQQPGSCSEQKGGAPGTPSTLSDSFFAMSVGSPPEATDAFLPNNGEPS